jgi:hypothetical protein
MDDQVHGGSQISWRSADQGNAQIVADFDGQQPRFSSRRSSGKLAGILRGFDEVGRQAHGHSDRQVLGARRVTRRAV